jgi:hypothetical protein
VLEPTLAGAYNAAHAELALRQRFAPGPPPLVPPKPPSIGEVFAELDRQARTTPPPDISPAQQDANLAFLRRAAVPMFGPSQNPPVVAAGNIWDDIHRLATTWAPDSARKLGMWKTNDGGGAAGGQGAAGSAIRQSATGPGPAFQQLQHEWLTAANQDTGSWLRDGSPGPNDGGPWLDPVVLEQIPAPNRQRAQRLLAKAHQQSTIATDDPRQNLINKLSAIEGSLRSGADRAMTTQLKGILAAEQHHHR